jgi:hypothetical protein
MRCRITRPEEFALPPSAIQHGGLGNPLLREAAGQAAKVRIREQYLWARIADNIQLVYFTVTGGGRPTTSAKKPNTRVEAATEAADRAKRIAG